MKKIHLSILLLLLGGLFVAAVSNSGGPPAARTGAPGESTCAVAGCHGGTPNSANGSVTITVGNNLSEYEPGQTYEVRVEVQDNDRNSRFGFQLTALNSNGQAAGDLATINNEVSRITSGGRIYVRQTGAGNRPTAANLRVWTFNWTAPASDVGPVTLYAASLAANGNGSSDSGDHTFTNSLTLTAQQAPVPEITIGNADDLAGDRCAGVSFAIDVQTSAPFDMGNTFTAELSDDSGTFDAPTAIGSLENNEGGSLFASIPFDLPTGSAYRIRITSNDPATQSTNQIEGINLLEHPEEPTIAQDSDTLSVAEGFETYQWYRDGEPIKDGTENRWVLQADGEYYVEVGLANGCMRPSDASTYLLTGRAGVREATLVFGVHPNPTEGMLSIAFDEAPESAVEVSIINLMGQIVYSTTLAPNSLHAQLDLNHLPAGSYICRLTEHPATVLGIKKIILSH